MKEKIHPSWKKHLEQELTRPYFQKLHTFVEEEYRSHHCYPNASHIFAAFEHCHFEQTKVVIIGQDPYHGKDQANGLCFSVTDGIAMPPSLVNIFKEIESDLGQAFPETGNLERWAKQGVLLLNATLTVRAGAAGSHQKKGWEHFTDAVIALLSEKKEGIVFMLWGGYAKKKGNKINSKKHYVLTSGHPSPLSANRGYWFGNSHFSQANHYIIQQGQPPVCW